MVTVRLALGAALAAFPAAAAAPTPYVVVVDYTAPSGAMPALLALIETVAKASIAEPGCERFDVVQPATTPDHVTLFEVFDDQAAFQAHADSPHFKRFAADSAKLNANRTATPGGFILSLHKS